MKVLKCKIESHLSKLTRQSRYKVKLRISSICVLAFYLQRNKDINSPHMTTCKPCYSSINYHAYLEIKVVMVIASNLWKLFPVTNMFSPGSTTCRRRQGKK